MLHVSINHIREMVRGARGKGSHKIAIEIKHLNMTSCRGSSIHQLLVLDGKTDTILCEILRFLRVVLKRTMLFR